MERPAPNLRALKMRVEGKDCSPTAIKIENGPKRLPGVCRVSQLRRLGALEARRQPDERVNSIGRGRDTEIHAGIELKILAQLVREAGAEDNDVATRVLRVEAASSLVVGAELVVPLVGERCRGQ